jgi:hypothetical protein
MDTLAHLNPHKYWNPHVFFSNERLAAVDKVR